MWVTSIIAGFLVCNTIGATFENELTDLGAFEVEKDKKRSLSAIQLLSKLTFKELSILHETYGATPASAPLGLLDASKLNAFRSRSLAQTLDKFYDGDWVFEAPTCDNGTQTLGYLMLKGRRIALATWKRLDNPPDDESWKRGMFADFTQPIRIRCDDTPSIVNPLPFNMIADVVRAVLQ